MIEDLEVPYHGIRWKIARMVLEKDLEVPFVLSSTISWNKMGDSTNGT
jgi:hypothetical protein